ncbi:MAG: pyruvate formate lyase family protein [Christensenellales bacterium]|jgi:pyruvate-formate lyase
MRSERMERAHARGQRIAESENIKLSLIGKALFEERAPYAHHLRRAAIDRALFEEYPIEIDDDEWIIGRFADPRVLTPEEEARADEARRYLAASGKLAGTTTAFTGHRVVDYEKLLHVGIRAILAEVEEKRAQVDFSNAEDAAKAAFYDSVDISLRAFVRLCERAREALTERAAAQSEPAMRARLLRMAANFERAPMQPCTHFHEALQIMWMLQFALCLVGDISLTGRLDNYMLPFYQKDIESGHITKEFAFELIEHLYFKHNEIYGTWPASIMVGGVDRDGRPVWNELTEMCIEAIRTTGLVNPAVSVAYTPDMPEPLMDKSLEIIAQGYTRPAFFNDRVIREGLRAAGMDERDSRYYVHSTCVEITPIGSSNVQVATPYINLNKAYEYIFNDGRAISGAECRVKPDIAFDLGDLPTFEDFKSLTKRVVGGIIRAHLEETAKQLYAFSQYCASPLASAFLDDCIARGMDAGAGGAKYSYVYPCFPGFLNLVDALAAVRCAVYERGMMSLSQMGDLLRGNFEGEERMRQFLINRCPKIGNGMADVDALGVELYDFLRAELRQYTTSVGATFHPSYFAWIMHGVLGKEAAATPDGRKRGEALSECLGAVQGMDKNGPMGILRSIEKFDQKYGIGGIATNLRFTKKLMNSAEGRTGVKHYIRAFMDSGCFELQLNVIDQKDLIDAKANPGKHRTLMTRVAGYSDYFVNLAGEIQDEIIRRSEHSTI